MRALVVAGARPNFMKVAPILRGLEAAGHEGILLHTGQHYDTQMSDAFFRDLGLPEPAFHLGVGSGTHAQQTARVMEAFEPVLVKSKPDWVVVVGDVNSTLACALVAAKLKPDLGCQVAHVEAGLRSRDWRMPEEINRVLTDRVSDLLLTPSRDAHPNLHAEGIPPDRIVFVGNVMIDTLVAQLPEARRLDMRSRLGVRQGEYALVTLHRPSNVDDAVVLRAVLEALAEIAGRMPVVLGVVSKGR
jgi:UDP-N-acetylglucosamine 2-epimerase (non-hydrolysing)